MANENSLLKLKNVSKFYYNNGLVATGFTRISLEFNLGEFVVITGESGSGKSTLLNVISGLDTYEEGEMYINGKETSHYGESDFEDYRKTYIGNIFQNFNLVNSYTVYQNVELVLLLNGYNKKNVKEKIITLLKEVDLYKYRNTKVSRLSGGQKQRVAIARALAKDTPIIIADEPTGALDVQSAKSVLKLLSEIAKEKLVIIVTHNYEQVEKYATRKIEMHDGKVRDDILLKETDSYEVHPVEYKNITKLSKFRLGFRNIFNIFYKFILLFIVFIFMISAFLATYSSLRELEYKESMYGYNYYFSNTSDKRLVIKKSNKTSISEEEFKSIESLKGVDYIEKDDILLDTYFNVNDDDFYFLGYLESANNITSVDYGRLPKEANEVVVSGYKYDYYLTDNQDKLFEAKLNIYSDNGTAAYQNVKVVGIILNDDNEYSGSDIFYVKDELINELRLSINSSYSKIKININNMIHNSDYGYLNVIPNKNVKKGEVLFPDNLNYLCSYAWCLNKDISINISNLYYDEKIDLKVTKLYTDYNFTSLTGQKENTSFNNSIFISFDDYNYLFNKDTYQSSVFVDNVKNIDSVVESLHEKGFDVLVMKDSLQNDVSEILAVIKIFRVIITVVLFIVLFFISYFVISLIQKSKNIYYSTVRILGGNKKVIKDLIKIELFNIFHITFILFMLIIIATKFEVLNIKFLQDFISYLTVSDYIIIYFILFLMSYFISFRYSYKLFKSSAMKSYRQEV